MRFIKAPLRKLSYILWKLSEVVDPDKEEQHTLKEAVDKTILTLQGEAILKEVIDGIH